MTIALTLYYREGCHLCEDMQHGLENLVDPINYTLERVDIDADAELKQKYNADVPVLSRGNEVICQHFLDVASLERVLKNG